MSIDMLKDVVAAIMAEADEIRRKPVRDNLDFGQLLAYAESLCIIKDACGPDEVEKIGLGFDIDARYLTSTRT